MSKTKKRNQSFKRQSKYWKFVILEKFKLNSKNEINCNDIKSLQSSLQTNFFEVYLALYFNTTFYRIKSFETYQNNEFHDFKCFG